MDEFPGFEEKGKSSVEAMTVEQVVMNLPPKWIWRLGRLYGSSQEGAEATIALAGDWELLEEFGIIHSERVSDLIKRLQQEGEWDGAEIARIASEGLAEPEDLKNIELTEFGFQVIEGCSRIAKE
jgi:hypothetical protein